MKIFRLSSQTFGPDHKNIIDIVQPSVRLKWGIFQSVSFEKTKKNVVSTSAFIFFILYVKPIRSLY